MSTGIEWTDETWNPVVGCEWASPGCDGCYAARDAFGRLKGSPIYAGLAVRHLPSGLPRFTGEVRQLEQRLDQPLHWRRPRRIFVNSMSDLFHPDVPDDFIFRVFTTMARAEWHTFQVLTKRPQRMAAWTRENFPEGVPRHVWLGTSIESERYAFRARHLAECDSVRFLSVEPLIGPVDLLPYIDALQWVIVGGESGPHARPMHPLWARRVRDLCVDHHVPFLFKQWGEWVDSAHLRQHSAGLDRTYLLGATDLGHSVAMYRVGKKPAGRVLDGRTWDEYPAERTVV